MAGSTPTTVYAADLRHNYSGVLSVDAMPLGVGYIKAVMDSELQGRDVDVRLFAYPDVLLEAIEKAPPDVLMVGNYMWNEALGHFFLRRLKALRPDALAVMGGPNLPEEPERQVEYVEAHPEIDIYLCGEADYAGADLTRLFLDTGKSVDALLEGEIPSAVYRQSGSVVRSGTQPRRKELDDIPSPFLTGIMDEFFDGKLAPMIETNRGCPFQCKFCVQGTAFYNKVNYFDLDRLREEIHYIARRVHDTCPSMGTLRIADPNFGMYKRDVEISGFLGEMQKEFGWPTFIDATTGKNKPERIIECLEKVNGALVLYQAVQSLDDEVLRNIDRSNIKLDAYEKIMIHVRGRGLRSNSDLILGLPGESMESHLRGLFSLVDAGTDQAHCFQAMVLKGSDLETTAMRERYHYVTRFRVLPKNYGVYGDEQVFDIEEIIVGTDTLPFEDYVQCRKHHLTFSLFWNDSWFKDVLVAAKAFDIAPSAWLSAMLEAMESAGGSVKKLLDDFVDETVNELFPTLEACRDFYAR
ncbi:MAG: B12-binding domain-containing radical SAM protein, partial [Proteobacteria bacterium]|nr:B12-binding domain-containing radical SAM protein [Pseudomonadota bacterium]